jgi:glycosyltransferase involved in cell wall biosynthesis
MAHSSGSNQLHVIQVIPSLYQAGSERLAYELVRKFDPCRFRSSICALDLGGPLAEDLQSASIPFYIMRRRPGKDWRLFPRLYRLFRRERVDLVQTHHLTQLIYGGVAARLAGIELVHVEHEYFSLQKPKAKRYLRALSPFCQRVVAVGDRIRTFLLQEVKLSRSKVVVIPNGVDVSQYVPGGRVSREILGLSTKGRLIGHVARLEPEKDQETLLRAFRIVLDTYADARLEIVGEGSLRPDLEKVARMLDIADRVDFLGLRTDVAHLLPHFEMFVLSSVREGLPLALLEAMACARPVVATAVGELPRVLHNGVTGLTVSAGDPRTLAASISTVLKCPVQAAAMGHAARQFIEERFSIASTLKQYEALYDSLLR